MSFPKLKYFEFTDKIGEGGTGTVYLAIDKRSGYPVAVKTLLKKWFKNSFFLNNFIQEANIYLYLEHKNIAELRDFIIEDDAYYLVMEYIDGYTLEYYINNITGTIPEEIAIRIFCEILDGLDFAHANKIYHLDIKPSNIMIKENGNIKILDFGISTSKQDKVITQNIMGTPMYMSPEQALKSGIDWRSDIYSLGVTLFQMVTGRLPFSARTNEELLKKIVTDDLPRIKTLYPHVSDQMQEIIDKATMKRPEDRFQNCREFRRELLKL